MNYEKYNSWGFSEDDGCSIDLLDDEGVTIDTIMIDDLVEDFLEKARRIELEEKKVCENGIQK